MEKFSDQRTRELYRTGEQENFFIGPKYEPEYIKTIVLWSSGLKVLLVSCLNIVLWSRLHSEPLPDIARDSNDIPRRDGKNYCSACQDRRHARCTAGTESLYLFLPH